MSGSINRDSDKFMLRLPDGMRERIKIAADANNRSMNAEIVATLELQYPPIVPLEVNQWDLVQESVQRIRELKMIDFTGLSDSEIADLKVELDTLTMKVHDIIAASVGTIPQVITRARLVKK